MKGKRDHHGFLMSISNELDSLLLYDRTRISRKLKQLADRQRRNQSTDQMLESVHGMFERAKQTLLDRQQLDLRVTYPKSLPISDRVDDIKKAIRSSHVVIVL